MNKNAIFKELRFLNSRDVLGFNGEINKYMEEKLLNLKPLPNMIWQDFNLPYNKISIHDESVVVKFLCHNFELLRQLSQILDKTSAEDVLSVQQTKTLKLTFNNTIRIGILANLVPVFLFFRSWDDYDAVTEKDALIRYQRLAATVYCILECVKCSKIQHVFFPSHFPFLLCAFYQIVYCPLKKPSDGSGKQNIVTESIYKQLLEERDYFKSELNGAVSIVSQKQHVQSLMYMLSEKAAPWLKTSVTRSLNSVLVTEGGFELIVSAMFHRLGSFDADDTASNWRVLNLIGRMVLSIRQKPVFQKNVSHQLISFVHMEGSDENVNRIFARVFVVCVKKLYLEDPKLVEEEYFPVLFNFFDLFIRDSEVEQKVDITDRIFKGVRLAYLFFVEEDANISFLPSKHLNTIIYGLFRVYELAADSSMDILKNQLQAILIKYIESYEAKHEALDCLLFDLTTPAMTAFKHISLRLEDSRIMLHSTPKKIKRNHFAAADCFVKLIQNSMDLQFSLFAYFLNCLTQSEKYFKTQSNKSLLDYESDFVLDEGTERNLVVYKYLSAMCEDKNILRRISQNPTEVVKYMAAFLEATIQSSIAKTDDVESSGFQTVFAMIMTLQALVTNCLEESLFQFRTLLEPLQVLKNQTSNMELIKLIDCIEDDLAEEYCKKPEKKVEEPSNFEKAVQDICDPLLPVRGHGLLALAKLVEEKDVDVFERKQFVLNIFQQNLKSDDSFIYLNAIRGLAAMGDLFPQVVLNSLTDEYLDFSKKDAEDEIELRMKIGEVLVRVTKKLGELTVKYKALLLNTFLTVAKDEDELMRASSLANLGEVCRILGCKLGTIITEILSCTQAVITTDKAVEPRRAAVDLIRQLFVGLEVHTIEFMKEDLLVIYRTLKQVYNNDDDGVMRLQAQLALEELNENVKNYILPKPKLDLEKNIIDSQ